MGTIGYIKPTARYPRALQRKQVLEKLHFHGHDTIVDDPKDGTFADAVQVLRNPGDAIIVPKMSVISRTRRELEKLIAPLLKKGFAIEECVPDRRVTNVDDFLAGLWAAQRQGPTRKNARKAAAQSSGRSISPKKLNEAKKVWRDPAVKTVHEAAKITGISVSTLHRHFGRRFAVKDEMR